MLPLWQAAMDASARDRPVVPSTTEEALSAARAAEELQAHSGIEEPDDPAHRYSQEQPAWRPEKRQ